MRVLMKFSRLVDGMAEFLGQISLLLVVVTVVVGFYNVLARFVGRYVGVQFSSNLFIELQWYLYSLVFLIGFPYIMRHGLNVRVDFIYAKWPAARKATLDFWGNLLFVVPFCILGIVVAISPVMRSWGQLPDGSWGAWELSPDPSGLPRAPIKSMIVVAFVVLLLQTLSELIKLWPVMRSQREHVADDSQAPLRIE